MGWPISYSMMAVADGRRHRARLRGDRAAADRCRRRTRLRGRPRLGAIRGFTDAIVGPFAEFFRVHGWLALLMLAMISLYRLPDFVMGPMANPYYHDLGLSKDAVGAVRGSIGLVGSLLGIAAGGLSAVRFGYVRTLIVGLILQSVGTAAFALLAYTAPTCACSAA